MNLLLTGASGFIGSALIEVLQSRGHSVTALARAGSRPGALATPTWDPGAAELSSSAVSGFDAIIHLAGEPIVGFWTSAKRSAIRESRVRGTELLTRAIVQLPSSERPRVFISASAVGFYGNRGDDVLDESANAGIGFLPETCVAWENASAPLQDIGVRVVWMRIGIVLDPAGGALRQMLMAFRLGVGGKLGTGAQWISWISRWDLVSAFAFVLENEILAGPVNATAPGAVRNAEFTKQLAASLHRPAFATVPAPMLRLLPGHMADEALLASAHVTPEKLQKAGFQFEDPGLGNLLARLK